MKIKIVIGFFVLAVILCAVPFFITAITVRKAQRLNDILTAYTPDKVHSGDIEALTKRFGGSFRCQDEWCEGNITLTNAPIHFLRLAPLMEFRALVHTEANTLSNFSLSLAHYGPRGSSIVVAKIFDSDKAGLSAGESFRADSALRPGDQSVTVRITPAAPEAQQQLVKDLHLGCLSKIGGCSHEQLGPEIWKLGTFARRID